MATHKYKGVEYEIQQGKRGGSFFIDGDGKKHYLKGTSTSKTTTKRSIDPIKKQEEKPVLKRYIGYYRKVDENGEMIDDFSEWCDAYSYDEAKREFEDRYSYTDRINIDLITRE